MKQIFKYYLISTTITFISCRSRFDSPASQKNLDYLVVDGFLNNSADSTIIHLSHTTPLIDDYYIDRVGELNAHLTIEDESGNIVYTFVPANNNGSYAVPGMSLDVNKKYRLRINTIEGNQYLSDDIQVKTNPAIDSVSWSRTDNGLTIYANTHDPLNNSKYYRWEYIETWDYSMYYLSELNYLESSNSFESRDPDDLINHCWKTVHSKEILLASSDKLSQDIISQKPIRFIPLNSFELTHIYSILVQQYTLTTDAFEYYQLLKKISEETGSVFDSQPARLVGNIHCLTNQNEIVIGYMTATNLQSKRIFISNNEVAPWMENVYCEPIHLAPPDSFKYYFSTERPDGQTPPRYTPVSGVYNAYGELTAVRAGIPFCTDCFRRGGTNVKPDFWP